MFLHQIYEECTVSAHIDERPTSSSGDSDWVLIFSIVAFVLMFFGAALKIFRGTQDGESSRQTVAIITFGERIPVQGTGHLCSDGNTLTVEIVRDQETRKITLANPKCGPISVEQ